MRTLPIQKSPITLMNSNFAQFSSEVLSITFSDLEEIKVTLSGSLETDGDGIL